MKLLILCSLIFLSCISDRDVEGVYVPVDYKNNFDTICIKMNGIYDRKVYNKNGKLLLKMKGEWQRSNDAIRFQSFYLNLDDDLEKYPKLVQDTMGNWGGYLGYNNGNLEFCIGHLSASLPNQNCYRKIKK
ncbi:hypothetical protein [Apibacter adventoris]|uniref:Lipoprotein n=1 Tax=Apibacter adventoris TaxID=1679466 RepID=A0A2S8AFQ5_9FLAO|nr:hypothetical protein [Apibacter adventoris]PQL94855.1 hypothetical protein C4S77_02410 [Apibacter adventoris]